jgi:hypothetical protein
MYIQMKKKHRVTGKNLIVKECAFCHDPFYAKRNSAKYCSDSCKVQFNTKNKNHPWYNNDPNEGKTLPPGTITSWEMPEDKLVFVGDYSSLLQKLTTYVYPHKLFEEKEYIPNMQPFSQTKDWKKSADQIFSDENFMEVFRISPDEYKLYVWPWGEDNEKPFE